MTSRLAQTIGLGTEFWNDSCAPSELRAAVAAGATGATSNPVIVAGVVKADPATWNPVLESLARDFPRASEDDLAWRLIEELGRRAAAELAPIHQRTGGAQGWLSMQVNPTFYRDPDAMVAHGRTLATLGPNIAIKAPCTEAGIAAMERLTAEGISVNATVSFSVSQAMAVAEAINRGLGRAKNPAAVFPHVTIMIGRIDDHLQRLLVRDAISIDPGFLHWAGIAVFKRAHEIFQQRGFRARLLAAAFRHHLHWSELIGDGVVMTIPYPWWKQFDASDIEPARTLARPVDSRITTALAARFPDFRRAWEPGALPPSGFASFGPTVHTLSQFLGGYAELLAIVRERIFAAGG